MTRICKDCVNYFYNDTKEPLGEQLRHLCRRSVVDQVTGEERPLEVPCYTERSHLAKAHECGYSGQFFVGAK